MTRFRRVPTVLAAGALAISLCLASSEAARAQATTQTSAALARQTLANQIETLGESQYAYTFAGAVLSPLGAIDVYAKPENDAAFIAAVHALNSGGFAVTYLAASRSYQQLDALNTRLIANQARLKGYGVNLAESSLNPVATAADQHLCGRLA